MEVWVLEKYIPNEGTSEILNVFENRDVGISEVNRLHSDIIWTEYETYSVSSKENDVIYYIHKFEVILDEVPITKN